MDKQIHTAKLDIVFDRPNEKSGRIYKKKQIEQQLQNLINDPSEYSLFIDSRADSLELDFETICGKIKSFQLLADGSIQARYILLDKTPMGRIFSAVNKEELPLVLTSVMTGTPNENGTVSDLKLHKLSFDLSPESV